MKKIALITSSGGHGFMELNFGKLHNQEIVAYSEKDNREDFGEEVVLKGGKIKCQ